MNLTFRPIEPVLISTTTKTTERPARRGVALAYTAVVMIVFFGFIALAIDAGRLLMASTELQTGADGGARAAIWRVPLLDFEGAQSLAVSTAAANEAAGQSIVVDSSADIEFGIWRRTLRTFEVLPEDEWHTANAVRVTATRLASRSQAVPFAFASLLGQQSGDARASAVAMIRGGWRYGGGVGIVGLSSISMNGTTLTDSYNASTGVYDAATARDHGTIASNGDIQLVGTVDINGNAHAGPDVEDTLSVNSNSDISGWRAPLEQDMVFSPASLPASHNNSAIALYMNSSGDFIQNGKTTMTVPGGTYVVRDLDLRANQTINVTGQVTIYVTGSVDMTGSIRVNQGLPSNLRIYVVGSGSVELGGGSQLYSHIYAPQSDVTIHGTSNTFGLFGSVISNNLTIKGNSAIHYDESAGFDSGIADDFYVELVK